MLANVLPGTGTPVETHGTAAVAAVPSFQHQGAVPPVWIVIPFVLLLLMIATGPLFFRHFWERHYPKVSIGLGVLVAFYYGLLMDGGVQVLWHTLQEYLSFIALLVSLFVVSGSILIRVDWRGSPLANGLMLLSGAVLSNLIGTTGASMLLIRPFLGMNAGRVKAFHVVFFIFIVSNIGGALTPIGDPPLFLGFLKGVPFFWVVSRIWLPWIVSVLLLIGVFMMLDARSGKGDCSAPCKKGGITVTGGYSFIYLFIIIVSVFLDPAVIDSFPSLQRMFNLPFGIREAVLFVVAYAAYRTADIEVHRENEFNFEPIREVALLFIGIFVTMIPALELVAVYVSRHAGEFSVTRFYWLTGFVSGVLDNAPSYLNFLAGAAGKFGIDITSADDVRRFAGGIASPVVPDVPSDIYLMAISMAAVFFGALTYIGNAPNFMVRNIAVQRNLDVPDFIEYIFKYSIPVLLPLFFILWLLFFNF
jgi:Na+/H+ antiporter NhaD/arsenite permease-like protein